MQNLHRLDVTCHERFQNTVFHEHVPTIVTLARKVCLTYAQKRKLTSTVLTSMQCLMVINIQLRTYCPMCS